MKKFDIPKFYRSPIISKVKEKRKIEDPRKKDFSPTILDFGNVSFKIARHFGFCFGVENAVEKAYRAIQENPGKRIFLLSQMIHNPSVNEDLESNGIRFLQDTQGNQMIDFDILTSDDIVIIPAFGTTLEIESKLNRIGANIENYNTTCPFVEKVWNRSKKLGSNDYTIIIHGKHKHEETRATFSHSKTNAPSLIVRDLEETKHLTDYILGKISKEQFLTFFEEKLSDDFNPEKDLEKIGVVNQTTMLASETQEITDFIRETMVQKYGAENIDQHLANTRDTLCYATNDNQNATLALLEKDADFAIVVGGHNSSNTTHLVELLESKFPTYFIASEQDISTENDLHSFNIHTRKKEVIKNIFSSSKQTIIITSGASCPDAIIDRVIQTILDRKQSEITIETALKLL